MDNSDDSSLEAKNTTNTVKSSNGVVKSSDNIRKIALGITIIILAVAGGAKALLDDNPETKPDIGQIVSQINQGINIIKDNATNNSQNKTAAFSSSDPSATTPKILTCDSTVSQ